MAVPLPCRVHEHWVENTPELLFLMYGIAACGAGAKPVALHGLQQYNARFTAYPCRLAQGGIYLLMIMAAAFDGANLFIGQRFHQLPQLGRIFYPVLAHDIAAGDRVHLVVAIYRLLHTIL